jgi:hypothetical protein
MSHPFVVFSAGFSGHDSGDAAEHHSSLQWWGCEIRVSIQLLELDADLERRIDLTLLHQISSRNALIVWVQQGAFIVEVRTVGILGKVEFDLAQHNSAMTGAFAIFLQNLEVDLGFAQEEGLVNCHPYGQLFGVVPGALMIGDRGPFGTASVLGRGGGWEVPFHKGCADNEGYVVEVDDLKDEVELGL